MKFSAARNQLLVAAVFLSLLLSRNALATIRVDKVLVIKSQKRLLLIREGTVYRSYAVALGREAGCKLCQGDCKTPEGCYVVDRRNANSRFYKSLHISYPNAADTLNARKAGMRPGGDVMIHGLPKGFEDLGSYHALLNWTKGCIAVSNAEMEEIWRLVPNGTPIEILP